jgi:predicted acylesterase/phospholipase RssA
VLLELGFSSVFAKTCSAAVGWIYGTSAGALAGTMAALDRLDDLEEFLLELQPERVQAATCLAVPRRLHDYAPCD